MNKIKNNQSGFSAVELILILLVVGLLGAVGFLVYKNQKKPAATTTTTTSTQKVTTEPTKAEVDPTADWTAFSSKEGEFSVKYPTAWVKLTCDSDSGLFLAANASSLAKCGSDSGGQMLVASYKGNILSSQELKSDHYPDLVTESVSVNGVTGKKQTGTYKSVPDEIGVGPADGDKKVMYTFYTNNRTYYASYSIKASYPDALSDFNLMVTKTLKFTP